MDYNHSIADTNKKKNGKKLLYHYISKPQKLLKILTKSLLRPQNCKVKPKTRNKRQEHYQGITAFLA